MTYQCQDCSYKRNATFPAGRCPACGSFNISGGCVSVSTQKPKGKTWRLVFLVGLWGYLLVTIYQKVQT